MNDLGTLPGDFASLASAINGKGQVVGTSFDAGFNPRAFIWQDGILTDLNSVSGVGSPLVLLLATGINSRGQIVGQALQTSSGELHAFLATPEHGESASASVRSSTPRGSRKPDVVLPAKLRMQIRRRLRFRRHGAPLSLPWPY